MRVRAPGKVNLGLSVLTRRGDGFHEIETLFARLALADEVDVELLPGASGAVRLGIEPIVEAADPEWLRDSFERLPTDSSNLVVAAAEGYLEAAAESGALADVGVDIRLRKRLPLAAGLGGGSSDAAAVLLALRALAPADVDITSLGVRIGSDVPFFLLQERAAIGRGRGERLELVDLPALHLVLAKPPFGVSAAEAYGALASYTPRLKYAEILAALAAGQEPALRNGLQPGVLRAYPELRRLMEKMREAGLKAVMLSGSGPTCFGIAEDAAAAETAAAAVRSGRPDHWVAATRTA